MQSTLRNRRYRAAEPRSQLGLAHDWVEKAELRIEVLKMQQIVAHHSAWRAEFQLEGTGTELEHGQTDDLVAQARLHGIGNAEGRRGHPDMSDPVMIAAPCLMGV